MVLLKTGLARGGLIGHFGYSVLMLGRRDPQGYYVIIADKRAVRLLRGNVEVEELGGDLVVIRVKSRSKALRIYRRLRSLGILVEKP